MEAKELKNNWEELLSYITKYISEPRQKSLLEFYNKFEDRMIMYPASHKKEYHNAFPGGYVDHVLNVLKGAEKTYDIWAEMGANLEGFTVEELIFSALNHDLGKLGDENEPSMIPQDDQWRKKNLGEDYKFNKEIPFASVPDRSLFLLQSNGIIYSFNEMIAIQTHDGLYDEGNFKYLKTYLPETKPRNCLPYILHQADMMAARIEFERHFLNKGFGKPIEKKSYINNVSKTTQSDHNKALSKSKNPKLQNLINNL